MKRRAIRKLVIHVIKIGFRIRRFLVKAKAKNIAVIGVREHLVIKAFMSANT